MEAYLINPVERKARKTTSRRHTMAKKRKSLKGRARNSKGQLLPMGRKARKSVKKVYRRKTSRRTRHSVKRHIAHRKSTAITVRKRSWSVKRHMSNPFSAREVGSELVAVGIAFGTLFAVGFLNRQSEKLPLPANRWMRLATKLGVAMGSAYGVTMLSRKGIISSDNAKVARAMCYAPLGLALINEFAPAVAGQIALQGVGAELAGYYPQELGQSQSYSDGGVDAELAAELEQDDESSAF